MDLSFSSNESGLLARRLGRDRFRLTWNSFERGGSSTLIDLSSWKPWPPVDLDKCHMTSLVICVP
jgi:hypothetical protein